MDITLIVLCLFLLIAILIVLLYLFKSFSNKSFKASDGSIFNNQSELDSYKSLYTKTKTLFLLEAQKSSVKPILGFEQAFLQKLTKDGFSDLKTLFKYRKQIKSLSDLINT
tara:strand:- start:593 stop:925 length:333 start_codon:yes stop_codon:yes gene_type:complete